MAEAPTKLGTFRGVFTPCVLMILGVILFLRTGYVVGHAGLWGMLVILAMAKLITVTTTFSLLAIASNQEVRGGGVYYMISRVLGPDFGGSIGLTLFFAQAVSIAFFAIGFGEALVDVALPLVGPAGLPSWFSDALMTEPRLRQLVAVVLILLLFGVAYRGTDIATKLQVGILALMALSIGSFLVGGILQFDASALKENMSPQFTATVGFWTAFAIFFPAVTGITEGADLSGKLKDPARTLARGMLLAIGVTALVYLAEIVLLAGTTDRTALVADPFASLQQMSFVPLLILVGVFAATTSSALYGFIGAPQIMQAMGRDGILPWTRFFAVGSSDSDEPRRATLLTLVIALACVPLGDLNRIAEVMSMFFLIAYGLINLSAFVESRSGNPSFRPRFRAFSWWHALVGAVGCGWAMLKIDETGALVAFLGVTLLYFYLRGRKDQPEWGNAKRGYVFARVREHLFYLRDGHADAKNWKPIVLAVSEDPVKDRQLMRVGACLEGGKGLYSVVRLLEQDESPYETTLGRREHAIQTLNSAMLQQKIDGFPEVIAAPSTTEGLSALLQSYSIGPLRPNLLLLGMPSPTATQQMRRFMELAKLAAHFNISLAILKPGAAIRKTKRKREIHLWWRGGIQKRSMSLDNGNLMAILAHMISLDREWSKAKPRILRVVDSDQEEREARQSLEELRTRSRIQAELGTVRLDGSPYDTIVASSRSADLVLLGMNARSPEEIEAFLPGIQGLLERLPTTLLIWSNGDADALV